MNSEENPYYLVEDELLRLVLDSEPLEVDGDELVARHDGAGRLAPRRRVQGAERHLLRPGSEVRSQC